MNSIAANIPKLYLLKFSRWFLLAMPIIVPFYQSNGLNMQMVMMVQAIFSISVVALEIPSGYFGDLLGRKRSIIVGAFFAVAGFATYSLSYGFWGFTLAAILLGVGASFISGSDSALLYDSLLELEKTGDFVKFEGRLYAIGNFSEAIAGVLGGLLAVYSLRYPFYAQTVVAVLGIFAALSLVEPTRHRVFAAKQSWSNIKQVLRFSLLEHPTLRWFIVFSAIVGCTTLTMAWFAQPYFEFAEIPLVYYGVLWTALNLTVGIASWFAHRIEHKMAPLTLSVLILVLVITAYAGTGLLPAALGLASIFVLYIGRGIATPVLKNFVNRHTPSEMRATVLSIRNFIIRLIFALLGPLLGYLTDTYSLQQAMLLAGVIFLTGCAISVFMLKWLNAFEQKPTV